MSDGGGRSWDSRIEIKLIKAPLGSRKKIQIFMAGFTPGLSQSEDGNTMKGTVEQRNLGRIVEGLRTLFNEKQVEIRVATPGMASMQPVSEMSFSVPRLDPSDQPGVTTTPPPQVYSPPPQMAPPQPAPQVTQRAPVPAHAQPTLPNQDGHQGGFWRPPPTAPSAAAVTPGGPSEADLEQFAEGVEGVWPFGNDYRPIDESKVEQEARKNRFPRDGKKKITLGVHSDRAYVVEPCREGAAKWKASKLEPDGSRTELGRSPTWRDAVYFIRSFERGRAQAAMGKAPAAPPVAVPTTVPAPQVFPGPSGVSPAAPVVAGTPGFSELSPISLEALTAPAPVPPVAVAPAVQSVSSAAAPSAVSMWQLEPGAARRWALVERSQGTTIQGDDLEDLLREAHAMGKSAVTLLGWDGGGPPPFEDEPEPEELEAEEDLDSDEDRDVIAEMDREAAKVDAEVERGIEADLAKERKARRVSARRQQSRESDSAESEIEDQGPDPDQDKAQSSE